MRMESHRAFGDVVTVRPLTIDDMSSVRYLHTISLKCLSGLGEDTLETQLDEILTPQYADKLMTGRLLLAHLHGELVGTAGWSMAADEARAAQLSSLYVHPMFTRCGIGRRLVRTVEGEARRLGFTSFTATVPAQVVPFLGRLGYRSGTRVRLGMAARPHSQFLVARRSDRVVSPAVVTAVAHA